MSFRYAFNIDLKASTSLEASLDECQYIWLGIFLNVHKYMQFISSSLLIERTSGKFYLNFLMDPLPLWLKYLSLVVYQLKSPQLMMHQTTPDFFMEKDQHNPMNDYETKLWYSQATKHFHKQGIIHFLVSSYHAMWALCAILWLEVIWQTTLFF